MVLNLSAAMSGCYEEVSERMAVFREILTMHGFEITAGLVEGHKNHQTDGVMCSNGIPYLVEWKNEMGSPGPDPIFQGATCCKGFIVSVKYTGSCLPSILMYLAGEFVSYIILQACTSNTGP